MDEPVTRLVGSGAIAFPGEMGRAGESASAVSSPLTLRRSQGLADLPRTVVTFHIGDFLTFAERGDFAVVSSPVRTALRQGSRHPHYVTRMQAQDCEWALRVAFATARKAYVARIARAVAARPDDLMAQSYLATVRLELGLNEAAAHAVERLIAVRPTDRFALKQLAEIRLQQRRPADAAIEARRVLALSPDEAGARVLLARALLLAGDAVAARECMDLEPAVDDACTRAMIEHSLGHADACETLLKKLIDEGRHADAAEVCAWAGDLERCRECLLRAMRSNIHASKLWTISHSPFMDAMHDDPWWPALLGRMNRGPHQRAAIAMAMMPVTA